MDKIEKLGEDDPIACDSALRLSTRTTSLRFRDVKHKITH